MKKLYKLSMDCGRSGSLNGVFTATDEEIATFLNKPIGFGEVLGKHSDIQGVVVESELTVISKNPDFIEEWDKNTGGTVGINPLDYYYDEENEEEY